MPHQASYATVTRMGDFGPWISRLILTLPAPVRASEVTPALFNVFCARCERADGSVVMHAPRDGSAPAAPSQGFIPILAARPCTEDGAPANASTHVALDLPECPLTKTIEGDVLQSRFVDCRFRVTQLADLPGTDGPATGLVFDTCARNLSPQLVGWHRAQMSQPVDGIQLAYGYYEPSFETAPSAAGHFAPKREVPRKAALIVWLHGAGEGGQEVERAYTGNRVTALSQPPIQNFFGGAAWVVVPQAPTFWMDDGHEQLGRSNESIYAAPLKALIDEFVAAHADRIDPERIVIGGLSNGGFMTVRMCADYPGFFCAGIPVCAPFFAANQTPPVVAALARTPLWFVHSKGDELVDPADTALPLYRRLREQGSEVHMTYFDHVEDLTGVYREADGSPKKTFNHGVWIHVYNDFCHTDLDGTNVLVDGEPVGVWEWAAHMRQKRS